MKARPAEAVPAGIWRCEVKFDGYRAIAVLRGGRAELWSRNRLRFDHEYPNIVDALSRLPCREAVIDGEVVVVDPEGRTHFQELQHLSESNLGGLRYYVFDLLTLDGESWLERPIEERQQRLKQLLKAQGAPLALSPVFEVEPTELLAAAREQGLEGIIAKQPGSLYEPGARSGTWLKCKVLAEQEFVIGGFTPPQGSRSHFGALLVGYWQNGKLFYAGKVGTGFTRSNLTDLHSRFSALARRTCPFSNLPMEKRPRFGTGMTAAEMRRVTWMRPSLVAQIRFGEWTRDGLLRQPVFLGLRKDKSARDVHREPGPISDRSPKRGRARSQSHA